ncbi:MAG: hypothetical protein WD267_02600 [Balneolales bacterium]
MKTNRIPFLLIFLILSNTSLYSQNIENVGFGKFALMNGTIHTVSNGIIEGGIVLVHDETISFVGKNARISPEFILIDLTGKHIYPGFVDYSSWLRVRNVIVPRVSYDYTRAKHNNFTSHASPITMDDDAEYLIEFSTRAAYEAVFDKVVSEALNGSKISPERIFGKENRIGRIKAGNEANLIICDGDPFDSSTIVEQIFIRGHKIPMENLQAGF